MGKSSVKCEAAGVCLGLLASDALWLLLAGWMMLLLLLLLLLLAGLGTKLLQFVPGWMLVSSKQAWALLHADWMGLLLLAGLGTKLLLLAFGQVLVPLKHA